MGQLFASAAVLETKKITEAKTADEPEATVGTEAATDPEKKAEAETAASCPSSGAIGSVLISPSKPIYCQNDNINCKFSTGYPISGSVMWNYTGSYSSNALSGPNNIISDFYGLTSAGNVVTTGSVIVGALTCTFSITNKIKFDDLLADAGPDMTYMPGYSSAPTIGVVPCEIAGIPGYGPESWAPMTYVVGPPNACQTKVDNMPSSTTFDLTVSDTYCTATDQMVVTLACPPADNTFGYVSISPSKTQYCPGDNISGSMNFTNSYFTLTGSVGWSFTGSPGTVSGSGTGNVNYSISNLAGSGSIIATGSVQLNGGSMLCPFNSRVSVAMSNLTADAGPDLNYTPGVVSSPLTLGANPCGINGTPGYSESWSPTTFFTSGSSICQPTLASLTSNMTYDITVTDANGCTATDQASVTLVCPSSSAMGNISISPHLSLYCPNSNISGSFNITNTVYALSGSVTWTYTGTPAISSSGTGSVNYAVNGLTAPGDIKATGNVILIGGTLVCPFTANLHVPVSDLIADAGADLTYTPGVSGGVNIGGSPCAIGGSPAYTQSWTPTTYFAASSTICQPLIKNLVTDMSYTITVKDAIGCTNFDVVNVVLACPSPTTLVSLSSTYPLQCPGSNATGSASVNNSFFNFTGSNSWSYNGSPGTVTGSGANNQNFTINSIVSGGTITATGSVQITGGGTLVCPYSAKLTLTVSTLVANAGADMTYTPGVSSPLTIGANPCASNGSPSYSEAWTPTTFFTSGSTICQPTVSALTSNKTYDLTVTDAAGCTATDQMSVTLACPTPSSLASVVASLALQCPGGTSTGSLNISNAFFTLSNPVNWSYSGTPGISGSGTNSVNFNIVNPSTAGTVTATGSLQITGGGTLVCPFSSQLTLTLSTLAANAGADKTYTPGISLPLTIGTSPCASNGTPGYSDAWSPGTFITSGSTICQPTVSALTSNMTYDLTVTDATGCTAVDQMSVTLACPTSTSLASVVASQSLQCPGGTSTGSLNISNASFMLGSPVTWFYSGAPGISGSGTNSVNFNIVHPATAGTVTAVGYLQVTGGTLLCPFLAKVTLTLSNLLADAGPDLVYVPGSGSITVGNGFCFTGGTPAFTASWTPATGVVSTATNCTVGVSNLSVTTIYTLTVSDALCSATDQMTVTLACPSPTAIGTVTLTSGQPVYCPGASLTGGLSSSLFSASAPVSWSYSSGGVISGSGTNSVNFGITGLNGSGVVTSTGTVTLNGGTLTCPFTATGQVNQSLLSADAGASQIYLPGGPPVIIGGSPCAGNAIGTPTAAWSPTATISSSSICNPAVSGISTNVIYTLTVADMYCTAVSQVTVYNAGGLTNNKYYAVLKKELDAGYFNSINISSTNFLYFKFDEEYYVPASTNLTYKIYDNSGSLVGSLPSLIETIGDNRFSLNVASLGAGYYKLYVYNQKNEMWQSRIKIN